MRLGFEMEGGLFDSFELMGEKAADLGPPLRAFAKKDFRPAVQARFDAGGPGWKPLAPSTLKKRAGEKGREEARAGAAATRAGRKVLRKLRADLARSTKRFSLKSARNRRLVMEEAERLLKGEAPTGSLTKAQYRSLFARMLRAGVAAGNAQEKLLGRLPQSIRTEVHTRGGEGIMIGRSAAGIVGKVHNDGDSHVDARRYLYLTPELIAKLKFRLIKHGVSVLEEVR